MIQVGLEGSQALPSAAIAEGMGCMWVEAQALPSSAKGGGPRACHGLLSPLKVCQNPGDCWVPSCQGHMLCRGREQGVTSWQAQCRTGTLRWGKDSCGQLLVLRCRWGGDTQAVAGVQS